MFLKVIRLRYVHRTWLDDSLLQAIAEENNSLKPHFSSMGKPMIEWFTPADEVDLCGHATLAAAHVLYTHLHYTKQE
ncbi:PhzF family phenazine biosynthesis protein [Alteromonas mediterranea]|uniref:PhzF family phenazine biosynthesis protein n=1 Tax=Alteromonas mediterranea TaxID=314275 RepID=UPI00404704C4